MILIKEYNRLNAVEYAHKWALSRNPLFAVYDGLGGDCTNFISQCVLAGSCEMNYTPVFGWYYISADQRTASWTGVQFFYNFMTSNEGVGPFAEEVDEGSLRLGDAVQLGTADGVWYHNLLVTGFARGTYLISAHTDDALDRPLNTYTYDQARFIHFLGVRVNAPDTTDCFPGLLNGESLSM